MSVLLSEALASLNPIYHLYATSNLQATAEIGMVSSMQARDGLPCPHHKLKRHQLHPCPLRSSQRLLLQMAEELQSDCRM